MSAPPQTPQPEGARISALARALVPHALPLERRSDLDAFGMAGFYHGAGAPAYSVLGVGQSCPPLTKAGGQLLHLALQPAVMPQARLLNDLGSGKHRFVERSRA